MLSAKTSFQVLLATTIFLSCFSSVGPVFAETAPSKGMKLLRQGNVDAAINEFESSLQRNPNDLDSLLGMATVLKESKRADRAEQYLRRATKLSPGNEQAMSMLIEVLSWDKRTHKESMSLLINYIKKHPTDMKARRDLVRLASADKTTFDIAVEQLKYIIDRDPDDIESALHLARLRNWTPNWKESEKYFRIYLDRKQDDIAVREEYADLLAFQKKDNLAAAKEYRTVLKRKPKNIDARLKLTNVLEAAGEFKEAFAEYKQLQSFDPNLKVKRYDSAGKEMMVPIGLVLAEFANWKMKDYALSRQLYTAYLKDQPNDFKSRLEFFELLLHRFADRPAALAQIDIVLKNDPGNESALVTKCKTYMYAQQFSLAETAIRQLLRYHPSAKLEVFVENKWQVRPAVIALATMIHMQGKLEQADQMLLGYLHSHSSDATISRLLKNWQSITPGVAQMNPAELDQYLEKNPDDNVKRMEKVSYMLGKNELVGALEQMRILQAKKTDKPIDLYVHGKMRKVNIEVAIGQTLFRLKKSAEGKSVFDSYLSEHPDDAVARFEYAQLLSYMGPAEKKQSIFHFDQLSKSADDSEIESAKEKATIHRAILLAEMGKQDEANRLIDQLLLTNSEIPYLEQGEGRRITPALAKALILLFGDKPAQAEGIIKHYYPEYSSSENELVLSTLAQSIAKQKGRESEGLGLLDVALSKRRDTVLLQIKADLLAETGRTDDAIRLYENLMASSPKIDHWFAVRLGDILIKAGRSAEAIQVLKKYGGIPDEETGRHHMVADALIEVGEYDEGIRIYEDLLKGERHLDDDEKASIFLALSFAYSHVDQAEKSEKFALAAAELAPPEVLQRRVGMFFTHPKSREVIAKALYTLLRREPENTFYLRQLGELELWHLNQRDKGIATYSKYLALKPDDLEAKLQLANVYNYANQSKKSMKLFQELIAVKPDDPDVILGLASAQMNIRSEAKNSLANFQRYFALRPDDSNAKVLMVLAMCQAGRRGEAIQMLYDLRKKRPDDPQLLLVLARTEIDAPAQKETGLQHLREYLKLKPDDREAARTLANSLSWSGGSQNRKEAMAIFEQLASKSPDDTDLQISRASLLHRSGKGRVAFKTIHKILEENPENKQALLAMAEYHASNQDHFKAEVYLKRARSLYPEDLIVALDSARNFRSIGRYDKALAELRKIKMLKLRVESL
jgi:predicted Zn-dependent protease